MIAALKAVGDAIKSARRARREAFSDYEAGDFLITGTGRMEFDGPDAAAPIAVAEVRSALHELPDSELFGVAARVIEAWAPLMLPTVRAATDVDVLIDALRDRAVQFEAVERDADEPFPTPAHLGATLTRLPRRGE
ncbi:hypothetical protein MKUB_32720 [Mycobacterium kubicae]|uniref:Uncharacterized protein n=1 Tax=Mycobacterium kubicae TaxID=120959 RepID=A0AAX1J8U4_9MYCO|nr:hypothetical protein [Mycobacterium kubicae]MCV7095302.1 hypothetical protein [Mycobacterium kubicae]ORV97410.1 hypothetical protein AWC13_16485 [Mycobacterium kubicae]QNI14371.1 hypothetical protein GAN18_27785 [Mycobacterium kubicae]QPI37894.1 hypothetical protein I2456_27250 [Mycobacterium kubicae]GFG65782.1 hypothetical protein MKUB_32720 [Mycobacterium kubicae]